MKTCKHCGKTFETKAHNALYCPECRKEVKKERRKKSETVSTLYEKTAKLMKDVLEKAAVSSASISQENPCKKKKKGAYAMEKPFPNISLNKLTRKLLMQEVESHLNKKYPQPSSAEVTEAMSKLANGILPDKDKEVLEKYKAVDKRRIEFSVACSENKGERKYWLSNFGSYRSPGTEPIIVEVWKTWGGLDSVRAFEEWSVNRPALVAYARECEIWDCEIQKARKAWQEIIESTTRVNHLPEEARPIVEKVFARQMGLEDVNLNTIRRFEKED